MANSSPPDAIEVFQAYAIGTLADVESNPTRRPRRYEPDGSPDPLQSLLWQVSLGGALGVLYPKFVHDVESFAKRIPGLQLPSSVYGVDSGYQSLRFFFEFVSLEAELTDLELAELVKAADRQDPPVEPTLTPGVLGFVLEKDHPRYTWPLIRDVLAGSEKVDGDTAAACLEVMSQLLAFDEDIRAFEQSVANLPHTSALVKKRFAAVHRAAAAITQYRGEPKPRAMAHA